MCIERLSSSWISRVYGVKELVLDSSGAEAGNRDGELSTCSFRVEESLSSSTILSRLYMDACILFFTIIPLLQMSTS